MSSVDSPSVRERRLARDLREVRIGAEMAGNAVAEALGWSASKVSRIETGRIGISPGDLDLLIELYRVPTEQAEYLRRLAPPQALRSYCAVLPHPLLMTADYTRQVVLATWLTPSPQEIDRRVRVCLRRQAVLDENAPPSRLNLSVVIDEAVLRRSAVAPGGGGKSDLHDRQLEHLLRVADRPNVRIQVLPFAAGIPPVSAGSFSILESRATGAPDVVYLENKTRIFFVDGEAEVHRYARDFDLLTEMALSPADSLEAIERIRTQANGASAATVTVAPTNLP